MVKVLIEGYGTFQIDSSKVSELLGWLSTNESVRVNEKNAVREVRDNQFTGRELLEGWYG